MERLNKFIAGENYFLLRVRRHLHQFPELRWEEKKTIAFIRREIEKFNSDIRIKVRELRGGLVIDFIYNISLPFILFRADVDAIPVQEETGLAFSSKTPNVSHSCAHDAHIAMLLTAMKIIAEGGVELTKNIRFVFQRAEENPITESGGSVLVNKENVCHFVEAAFGLHLFVRDGFETGKFYTYKKEAFANSRRIKIIVNAPGGHASSPNVLDTIQIGIDIRSKVLELCKSLEETGKLFPKCTIFKSGTGSNVIPSQAEMWFSFRNFLNHEELSNLLSSIDTEVKAIWKDVSITHIAGHPALSNDPRLTVQVASIMEQSGMKPEFTSPIYAGEDFAHYAKVVPSTYMMLGAAGPKSGDHHSPTFNIEETVMPLGVKYWLLLATERL